MKTCKWCKKELTKIDFNLAENLSIPIGIVSEIERQVIDGECCKDCFDKNTGFSFELETKGIQHCLQCGYALYPTMAKNIKAYVGHYTKGHIDKEIYLDKICKLKEKMEEASRRTQGLFAKTALEQNFRDELICKSCYFEALNDRKKPLQKLEINPAFLQALHDRSKLKPDYAKAIYEVGAK